MVSAELRTHHSNRSFDLKFYNPTPELYESLISFLAKKKQLELLAGNYAAGKDGVSTAFGFESRAGTVEKNERLISLIKQFCNDKGIKYSQSVLASSTHDEEYTRAAS